VAAGAIFLVVGSALSVDLGTRHVSSLDEARPGLVVKDMLGSGRWGVPHLGDQINPVKPPLFYWPIALASRGGVTEWSLRLPSVLAAAATSSVTFLIGAELLGPAAGLVASAVLASSPGFVEWARTGRMEMLLTLWITLALWSFVRWLGLGRRSDALWAGLWIGLGVLTKGPAALIPVAGGALALVALRGRWPGRVADLGRGLGLGALVVLAWSAAAWLWVPDFTAYAGEFAPAFVAEMRNRPHRPFGYALRVVAVDFLPWSTALPLAPALLRDTLRQDWRALAPILSWVAILVAVFAVAIDSRPPYVLPIYPPLALLIAHAAHRLTVPRLRWLAVPPALAYIGLALFSLGVVLGPGVVTVHGTPQPVPAWVGVAVVGVSVLVLAGGCRLLRASRPTAAAVLAATAMLATVLLFDVTVGTPHANAAYPTRRLAERLAARLPADAEVSYADYHRAPALLFYLPQRVHRVRRSQDLGPRLRCRARAWALVGESDAARLRHELGDGLRRFEQIILGQAVYVLVGLDGAAAAPGAPCPAAGSSSAS
jgi:4-amino-4-deoxy-L-arabinose transferase-like glycosyltransferase